MKNLFISESYIGNHALPEFLEADVFAFTFFTKPRVFSPESLVLECDFYLSGKNANLNGKNVSETIRREYFYDPLSYLSGLIEKNSYGHIFVAFDLDETGEVMSGILYHYLKEKGINAEMTRMPLTDEGYLDERDDIYVGIGEFMDRKELDGYLRYFYINSFFKRDTGISIREANIADALLNRPDGIRKLNDFTNTHTHVVKHLLKET